MICPQCKADRVSVINSDETEDGKEVIRRRRCLVCGHRWPTRELHAQRLQSPIPPTKRRVSSVVKKLTRATTSSA